MKETGRAESTKPLHQQGAGEHQPDVDAAAIRQSAPTSIERGSAVGGSQMLTINEVAHLLRLHPTTVYRLAKKGALPAFKIGYSWRFDSQDLNRWRGEQYRVPPR